MKCVMCWNVKKLSESKSAMRATGVKSECCESRHRHVTAVKWLVIAKCVDSPYQRVWSWIIAVSTVLAGCQANSFAMEGMLVIAAAAAKGVHTAGTVPPRRFVASVCIYSAPENFLHMSFVSFLKIRPQSSFEEPWCSCKLQYIHLVSISDLFSSKAVPVTDRRGL
jgi:hypothetical protein